MKAETIQRNYGTENLGSHGSRIVECGAGEWSMRGDAELWSSNSRLSRGSQSHGKEALAKQRPTVLHVASHH